jgi:hypothetical protein
MRGRCYRRRHGSWRLFARQARSTRNRRAFLGANGLRRVGQPDKQARHLGLLGSLEASTIISIPDTDLTLKPRLPVTPRSPSRGASVPVARAERPRAGRGTDPAPFILPAGNVFNVDTFPVRAGVPPHEGLVLGGAIGDVITPSAPSPRNRADHDSGLFAGPSIQ